MELKDFIAGTLQQLIDGVAEAQQHASEKHAIVNPPSFYTTDDSIGHTTSDRTVSIIDFDVAVTVAEGKELKGGIGAAIAVLGLGYQAKVDEQRNAVNRVRFTVPVVLPTQHQ